MKIIEMKKIMPDLFENIRKIVYKSIGRRRAGLVLGLSEIGIYSGFYIGAYHITLSNYIVLNKTPLYLIKDKSEKTIRAYIFHLLLHEYIHTLGYFDETFCRQLTYEISKENFGDSHLITYLASGGMKKIFPEIVYAPTDFGVKRDIQIEIVRGFDRSSSNYFS